MKKRFRLLIIICVILASVFIFLKFNPFVKNNSPQLLEITGEKISYREDNSEKESQLGKIVTASLVDTKGTYAVAVKNLKTGESYYLNENKIYGSASLYKLWVMATVFEKMEKGELFETDVLSAEIKDLNEKFDIATESAELKEGKISFTVSQALEQMITISHNYAALLLSQKVGSSSVSKFLSKNGFSNSVFANPSKTTAYDISLYFEKLYKGQLGTEGTTTKMIDLLKRQKQNSKLPLNLPAGTIIAHKTGELEYFSHDAGIVYSPKGDYIIAVLSESDYPPGAEERIAKISKAVYDYFANRK